MKRMLSIVFFYMIFLCSNSCQKESIESFTILDTKFINSEKNTLIINLIKYDSIVSNQKIIKSIESANENSTTSTFKTYYLIYSHKSSKDEIKNDTNYNNPIMVMQLTDGRVNEISLENLKNIIITLKSEKDNFEKYKNSKGYKDSIKVVEKEAIQQDKLTNPIKYLSVLKTSWQKGGFGSVGLNNITFKNEGVLTAYDITVKMTFFGESGTELSSADRVLTIVVPPGKSKRSGEINFGFINQLSERAKTDIIDAKFR